MSRPRALVALFAVPLLTSPVAAQTKEADGHPVQWQDWTFKWSILRRQGVALTDVTFRGKSVLKVAAVAEVFVPYHAGQPRPEDQRWHPFGDNMIPLDPGTDCLPGGTCQAFDKDGKPTKAKAAVMIHEENASLVYLGGEGRAKAKTLTVWSAYALGDYTYIFRWTFHEDGTLAPTVGLTGRLSHFGGDQTNSVAVGAPRRALGHVHNFFYCLDFDVDGPKNTVEEFEFRKTDLAGAKAATAWTPVEKEGGRELKPEAFRSWRVVNNASRNKQGNPRSYELLPGGNGIYRGATAEKFAQADVWVTRYKADEVPGTKLVADGLAACADGEDVVDQDVVLWYMMSLHHQPKAEDWSAMPIEWAGFKLAPRDFLDGSPVKVGGRK
jgi:primary-amine oxidase